MTRNDDTPDTESTLSNDPITDTDDSTTTPHSRRDMLKLAGTVGAASLGAVSLVDTAAAASDSHSEPAVAETTEETSFTPAEHQSDDAETLAVNPNCVWKSGSPGATIYAGGCARHAQNNAWDYAGHILNKYPGLDNCRTQVSVWTEIKAHPCCESITIGCNPID